jgi:hypothetical protein
MASTPADMQKAIEDLKNATIELTKAQKAQRAATPAPTTPLGQARQATADARQAERDARKKVKDIAKDLAKNKPGDRVSELSAAFRLAKGGGQALAGGDVVGGAASLAGVGEAGGSALAAIGPAGLAVAGVVAAGYACWKFKEAMDESTRSTIANYKELSKNSGAMAQVMANRDVRELLREREKGDRLAGVAGALTDAEQHRADASKELEIAWEEFKAGYLTVWNEAIAQILTAVNKLANLGANTKVTPQTLGGMMTKIADDADKKFNQHRANNK